MASKKVRDLYRRVPDVGCKGLCADACGVILLQQQEYDAIVEAVPGFEQGESLTCPLLVDGRCSAYDVRPLVCRLYGATAGMECPHGCQPWHEVDGGALIEEAIRIDPRVRSLCKGADQVLQGGSHE